ncbi:MAG: cytidine deaminase [Chitinophagaceae bacterium]|nr:MAG: cytidine deaminase [Chitinophagaceae bacterium]
MKQNRVEFTFTVLDNSGELEPGDAALLERAKEVTAGAYAPYSKFRVGAAARLLNGQVVSGTNQENASYPVGICAERSLLATAASLFPGVAIDTMAITYAGDFVKSDHPISPCGMCRQSLQEAESRGGRPIRLILGGQEGEVFIINTAADLLPFAFTPTELG